MQICFHLDGLTEVLGVWWEVLDGVAFDYKDDLSVAALMGREDMEAKPDGLTWSEYWTRLADRLSPLASYVVVEVSDESDPENFLFELARCHPSDPTKSVAALVEECEEVEADQVGAWLDDFEATLGIAE